MREVKILSKSTLVVRKFLIIQIYEFALFFIVVMHKIKFQDFLIINLKILFLLCLHCIDFCKTI